MKALLILMTSTLFSFSASANFIDEHNTLFRNQNLCDKSYADQVQAESDFKKMFATLVKDDEAGKTSVIEVADYGAYTTRLINTATGQQCSIILHEDCYSAYCEK
ncbi:hypothetical protein K2X05_10720 [bacterium]|nr:hypothetical protein [bacterium]